MSAAAVFVFPLWFSLSAVNSRGSFLDFFKPGRFFPFKWWKQEKEHQRVKEWKIKEFSGNMVSRADSCGSCRNTFTSGYLWIMLLLDTQLQRLIYLQGRRRTRRVLSRFKTRLSWHVVLCQRFIMSDVCGLIQQRSHLSTTLCVSLWLKGLSKHKPLRLKGGKRTPLPVCSESESAVSQRRGAQSRVWSL